MTLSQLHDATLEQEVVETIEVGGFLDRMECYRLKHVQSEQVAVERGRYAVHRCPVEAPQSVTL